MVPTIARFPNKTYIMPYWIEVDESATLADALAYVPIKSAVINQPTVKTFQVEGRPYVISVTGKRVTCSCPGFQFRHKCKHVNAFRS